VTMGHKYTRNEREGGMIDAYLHTKGGGGESNHSFVCRLRKMVYCE
jgi:hypothetical protein